MKREREVEIGVGFIGCGDISTQHAKAVSCCEGARLIGLWNYKETDQTAGGHLFTATERARSFGCKKYSTAEVDLFTIRLVAQ